MSFFWLALLNRLWRFDIKKLSTISVRLPSLYTSVMTSFTFRILLRDSEKNILHVTCHFIMDNINNWTYWRNFLDFLVFSLCQLSYRKRKHNLPLQGDQSGWGESNIYRGEVGRRIYSKKNILTIHNESHFIFTKFYDFGNNMRLGRWLNYFHFSAKFYYPLSKNETCEFCIYHFINHN